MSRRPRGFRFLAVCAAGYGVIAGWVALTSPDVMPRGEQGLVAALGMVAAEALWNGRPWAFRANAALAAAFYLSFLRESIPIGLVGVFELIVVAGIFIGPMLFYVHSRTARLRAFAAPRRPVPIAVPRP